jgi:RNA polymerase sigma-70 factor (sigma-E family)
VNIKQDTVDTQFRDFVKNTSPLLHRKAYTMVGNWATAEDLVQSTLANTYVAWRRGGGFDNAEHYTRRVLHNVNASWWRRRSSHEQPCDAMPEPREFADDHTEESARRDLMWRCLQKLPKRQRDVVVLRYYEDLSEADSARILGVSRGTIKSQCSRALASLRGFLAAA